MIKQKAMILSNNFYKWVILGLATFTQASATLVTYGVGSLAFFWQDVFQLTQLESGLLLSAVNIGPLFFMLFVGRLLDRSNEKLLIGLGSVLLSLSLLAVTLVDEYLGLLVVLFVVGVFYSSAQPGGSKVIVKWFPSQHRGLAMGVRQAGIPIGGAMAGMIIPAFGLSYGWHSSVYFLSGLCMTGGLMFLIFYKEPSFHEATSAESDRKNFRKQLQEIAKNKALNPVFFTGITMISLQLVIVGHLTIYFTHAGSIAPLLAGQLFSVTLFFGMAGRVLLASASDSMFKGDRRTPLFLSVFAVLMSVLFLSTNLESLPLWVLFVLCAWLGFFGIGWYSLFIVEVAEKAADDSVGVTVSFALTLNQIAIITAPPVFGLIVDMRGYAFSWLCLAFCLLLSGLWLYKKKDF